MPAKPIAFRNPELAALHAGELRHFRRLADGALKGVRPGDLLWIREPFFLPKRFEGFKPTEALRIGGEPTFLADVGFRHGISWLGRIRSARELCRDWHRRHIVIGSVRIESLQAIGSDDIAAGGYRDVEHFAELWDRDVSLRGRGAYWHDNPKVLRCSFSLISRPVPAPEPVRRGRPCKPRPERGSKRAELRRQLNQSRPEPVALPEAPVAGAILADGKAWCEQCQRRVTLDEGRACSSSFCPIDPPQADRRLGSDSGSADERQAA